MSILSELDPPAFEAEVARLSGTDLHPLHRKTLTLVARRIGEAPALTLPTSVGIRPLTTQVEPVP